MVETVVEELFPFDSFRHKQHDIIEAAHKALYEEGYDNVVIDAPVGTGKSGINTALLRNAKDGFYTTPEKKLRQQLEDDEVLSEFFKTLKARRDYSCKITGENCEECSINKSQERSCSEMGSECVYWANKMAAINHSIAVVTFSYLVIDGMIPEQSNDGQPISFGNREALVIDEAHNMAEQTASMHAGFKISPFNLPLEVFDGKTDSIPFEANTYDDVKDEVHDILASCLTHIPDIPMSEMAQDHNQCKQVAEKIEFMINQVQDGKDWVVDVDLVDYGNDKYRELELRPIDVSGFLREFVHDRAEKRIISTATLPFRNNPDIWLRNVGLDPQNTKILSVSMPFPVENRPIHTSTIVGKMSNGGDEKHWDEIMETLNDIARQHYNEKGLIHTSSYGRAQKIVDSVRGGDYPYLEDNILKHDRDMEAGEFIEDWQDTTKDMVLSPSMMEGVDLADDACRYQVLLKVPLPAMDSRTEYILNETSWGWNWYWEQAMLRVSQSYGRAVRSKTDFADYYVLDRDFKKLLKKRKAPDWVEEAINASPPKRNSIFDF